MSALDRAIDLARAADAFVAGSPAHDLSGTREPLDFVPSQLPSSDVRVDLDGA